MFESFEDLKKSAFSRHISKRVMRQGIVKMIPSHKTYVELMCGGARLLLAKQASPREVLNDSDREIGDALAALLTLSDDACVDLLAKNWKSSKTVWKKLSLSSPSEPVETLWKFLYTREFSTAKLGNSFDGDTSGQMSTIAKRALASRDRLSAISFEASDYSESVQKNDSPDTFFFLDVPNEGVDGAKLQEVLKSIKGRFLLTCVPGTESLFTGFNVNKVAQRRTSITAKAEIRSEREVTQLIVTNYKAAIHKAFEGTSFEVEEPHLGAEVVSVLKRTNGGMHCHLLDRPNKETDLDGAHYHLYMLPGEVANNGYPIFFETVYDGPHRHVLKSEDAEQTSVDGVHRHKIRIWGSYDDYYSDAETYDTDDSPGHVHDLGTDSTASDGLHDHGLQIDGAALKSLTPAEYTQLELRKSDDESAPYYDVPAPGAGQRLAAVKARVLKSGDVYLDLWIDNGVKTVGWSFGAGNQKVPLDKAEQLTERLSIVGDRVFPFALTSVRKVVELGALDSNFLLVDGDVDGGKVMHLSDCVVEHGLHTRNSHEYFFTKNHETAGVFDVIFDRDGVFKAKLRKDNLVPAVLSARARTEKWMPPEGVSALPSTIESLVPEELRYWLHKGESAIEIRDALIASQFITKNRLALVNSEIRMIETSVSLYKSRVAPELSSSWPVAKLAEYSQLTIRENFGMGESSLGDADAMLYDLSESDIEPAMATIKKLASTGSEYAVMLSDSDASRALALANGMPFRFVPEYPEHALEISKRIFLTSFPLMLSSSVEWLGKQVERAATKLTKKAPVTAKTADSLLAKREMRIFKTGADEERFVLGIVLEPETKDSQNDIYSEDVIRKAAHDFMAEFQNIGLMHRTIINGKAQILESYLAPSAFNIGDQEVKKGTWLFGVRVTDDDLWEEVKDNQLTGFSIGGSAVRTPEN